MKIKKNIIGEANVVYIESSFQASTLHPLKLSTILDSGTTLHVFNDLSRFTNFRKAPRHHVLIAGDSEVPILGYGDINLQVNRPNGSKGTLRDKKIDTLIEMNKRMMIDSLWKCSEGAYVKNGRPGGGP